jgi:hypothetical protein
MLALMTLQDQVTTSYQISPSPSGPQEDWEVEVIVVDLPGGTGHVSFSYDNVNYISGLALGQPKVFRGPNEAWIRSNGGVSRVVIRTTIDP